MTLDEAIKMYTSNAEYERTHGSLQGCLEFRQLAEWFKDYKRLLEKKYALDEEQEQLDFVQPHKRIPVTLSVSENLNNCDLISREAVLDTISELNAISFYEAQEDSKECYYAIKQAIKDLPPVKPQTGHWEWVQYDYNPKIGNWHCTECRCIVVECVDKNEKGGIPLYKYCPQCGAKMEVEQNG